MLLALDKYAKKFLGDITAEKFPAGINLSKKIYRTASSLRIQQKLPSHSVLYIYNLIYNKNKKNQNSYHNCTCSQHFSS